MMVIEVENVDFSYPSGVQALSGVSLSIGAGEGVAIMGENGAGKSTLAKQLNGLLKPNAGVVKINGETTADQAPSKLARQVGYVFQNPDDQLFAQTVRAEVEFGPSNLGFDPPRVREMVEQALRAVGLVESAGQHPYDLHPTDRKLVALASVLAMDTPVIILDEPTTGQDFGNVQRLGALVRDLLGAGKTILSISHDVEFCAQHFARIILMADCEIIADGEPEEVFTMKAELDRAAVDQPQIARLSSALGWDQLALAPESFVRRLARGKEIE